MRDLLSRSDRLDAERIAVFGGLTRLPGLSAITTSGRAGTRPRSTTIIAARATTALRTITVGRTVPTLGPITVRGTVSPLRTVTRRGAIPTLGTIVRRAPSGRSSTGRTALGRTAALLRATTGGTIP
ncbi:hypothetical protein BIV04_16005 [Frigoribacterium sp. MCBA15_019]|nr:hypothetical protein BIV04_16005 [Frigoribacterium sp. MCBA15_019]